MTTRSNGKLMLSFPLFVVVWKVEGRPPDIAFFDLITFPDPKGPAALALFTDRKTAERFRDKNVPTYQVLEITSQSDLALVLRSSHQFASVIVLDAQKPIQIAISELLR